MVATHRITVEEFAKLPLEGRWELIDGELVEMTPSSDRSGWVSGRLFSRLERFVDANSLGLAFAPETGFVLFGDRSTVRSPDGAVVLHGRLPDFTDRFVPVAPDLAIEVLSPSDRMGEALSKIGMYLQAGVQLVWLVDPAERSIVVFQPDAPLVTLTEGDTLDGGDVLPGFSIPVAEIFSKSGK
jgi:Uma2 family endonuclease